MLRNIVYILLFLPLSLLWCQKEYHFYSDQPVAHKSRKILNSFQYNYSQFGDKLFVNLTIELNKKSISQNLFVPFIVKFDSTGIDAPIQIHKEAYYQKKGNVYSFKIPINVNGINFAMISFSNSLSEEIGETNFNFIYKKDLQAGLRVALYDEKLDPLISMSKTVGQTITPIATKPHLFVRISPYESGQYLIKKIGSTQPFIPSESGLYEFSNDSSFKIVQELIVTNSSFPRFTQAAELILSLKYLCDSNSYSSLLTKEKTKKTLDGFWINFVGKKDLASKMVKVYYNRVFTANQKYTKHQLGWLTDQGKTEILLGTPNSVEVTNDGIKWSYTNQLTVVFTKNNEEEYILTQYNKLNSAFAEATNKFKTGTIE
jgi:GWxTD domain-containing protein